MRGAAGAGPCRPTAAMVLVTAIALLVAMVSGDGVVGAAGSPAARTTRWMLVVSAPRRELEIAAVPVVPGDVFVLEYTHSVSRSAVRGSFSITDGGHIQPVSTAFSAFGPGLPWSSGERLEQGEDGSMIVFHDEAARSEIRLWVSPLTGERLTVAGRTIGLAQETGAPLLVEIRVVHERTYRRLHRGNSSGHRRDHLA